MRVFSQACRFSLLLGALAVLALFSPLISYSWDYGNRGLRGVADEDRDYDERALPVDVDRLFAPQWQRVNGPQVRSAFRGAVKQAAKSVVRIRCNGRQTALGAVVAADGWIVTKATQLQDEPVCVLADGRELPAAIAGKEMGNDLALLKVDAHDLEPIDMSQSTLPVVGAWLATVDAAADPVAVGVVSVAARSIPAEPGKLGVVLLDERNLPIVTEVIRRSPADRAGVKPEDVIETIDGIAVSTRSQVIGYIQAHNPGDKVELVVRRGEERLKLRADLAGDFPGMMDDRMDFQNNMGSRLSVRCRGWTSAIQHDAPLRPSDCGGPVVDVDGRVVGLNIARAGRTESFALPIAEVRQTVADLRRESLSANK